MTQSHLLAVRGLPSPKWRGIDFPPYSSAGFSGGHRQSEREYPYVDAAGHDNIGRKPIPMKFRLMFLNSLRPAMFPDLFDAWTHAFILDGSMGELQHPLLGKINARPVDWDVELDASRTSGIIMEVTFTETIRDLDEVATIQGSVFELQGAAQAADDGMAALGFTWPTGERTTSFSDLIGQINGLIFSASLTVQGLLNQALGLIDRIVDTIQGAITHPAHALLYIIKTIRNRVKDLAKKLKVNTRPTAQRQVQKRINIASFAGSVGNTTAEIMQLNPPLITYPAIPAGTAVTYYAA